MEALNLKELIHTVRQELIDSEKERVKKGLSPLFKVDNLKIEVNFVVEKTKKTGGGIDIKIVDIGHDVTYSSQQIHKILLELKTCEEPDYELVVKEDINDIPGVGFSKYYGKLPGIKEYPKIKFPGSRPGINPAIIQPGQGLGITPKTTPRKNRGKSGL